MLFSDGRDGTYMGCAGLWFLRTEITAVGFAGHNHKLHGVKKGTRLVQFSLWLEQEDDGMELCEH